MHEICLMREADIPQVVSLEKQFFSRPWSEKSFRDALDSETTLYLAAKAGGQLTGYCGFYISYECADLCNMAVAKAARRQGVGEMLLKTAFEILKQRGVMKIFLEVRESNIPAIRLYEKLHFQKNGMRKNYYSDPPEDAVLMERNQEENSCV